ncbi:MAG: monofunctional biosynthetic peptidoglycan transglycosylase [Alphaproteobacteria bacterium]|nr:monofunctional biosynthetic peptidoglycan transglycosylase [Alphaproteobacteria bacterium]
MADRGQKARARAAQRALDEHLRKAGRSKRFGLIGLIAQVLFIVFVLVPVAWVILYRFIDPPATALMIIRAADGERIAHDPVRLNEMSPHAVRALIASEDQKFCEHDGFDVEAIQRALENNQDGGRLRGGSTISQQAAKNLFLWPSRSWLRKGAEAYFTFLIELFWPKRRIMEAYLNAIEFGDGIFGIEAAAQRRFRVSAADLTPLRAARLAAVVPSPNRYNAVSPGPYVRRQTQRIMREAQSVRARGAAGCVLDSDRR